MLGQPQLEKIFHLELKMGCWWDIRPTNTPKNLFQRAALPMK
jgi:hypothetical protein